MSSSSPPPPAQPNGDPAAAAGYDNPEPQRAPQTADADRVPMLQKLAIGVGEIPTIGRQSIDQLALPIYNITLGVSPVLVTVALSLTRLLDAFTDPLAGSLSDNTRSRFGRRKPYLFVATLVCAVTLPLIWAVGPGWSEGAYFAYFVATLFAFYIAYSFYNVPLFALALEATPDYHERTRVAAVKCCFSHTMGILGAWLFAITQLKTLGGTIHGARVVGILMGILVLAAGTIPVFFVREGYRHLALANKRLSLVRGIRETFLNKSFVVFALMATGNKLSGSVIQGMGIYIMLYHVYHGDLRAASILAGLWGTCYHLATIGTIPLVSWMSVRWGKLRALEVCLWIFVVGAASTWFTYRPGVPYLVLATALLLAPAQTAFYAILRSLVADICDDDELQTGLRREGMYASMDAWIEKAMASLGVILTGIVIASVGLDRGLGGHQLPLTILHLRLAYIFLPMGGVGLTLVALRYFPLTESRATAIRQELERRRGTPYAR